MRWNHLFFVLLFLNEPGTPRRVCITPLSQVLEAVTVVWPISSRKYRQKSILRWNFLKYSFFFPHSSPSSRADVERSTVNIARVYYKHPPNRWRMFFFFCCYCFARKLGTPKTEVVCLKKRKSKYLLEINIYLKCSLRVGQAFIEHVRKISGCLQTTAWTSIA